MKKKIVGVFATGAILVGVAGGVSVANTNTVPPSPVPGITSINSHPIGTVGSETEGVGGMPIIKSP